MKAIVLTAFGGIENLQLQEVSVPSVAAGELLVRVVATSINPLDCQIRRGDYPSYVPLPAITGMTCQASSSVQVWESWTSSLATRCSTRPRSSGRKAAATPSTTWFRKSW